MIKPNPSLYGHTVSVPGCDPVTALPLYAYALIILAVLLILGIIIFVLARMILSILVSDLISAINLK